MDEATKREEVKSEALTVTEYDAMGRSRIRSAPMPVVVEFALWTMQQQAIMLMKKVWKKASYEDVIFGILYCRSIGADPMAGEVFPTGEGRFGTSNKYKIRKALETGKVEGIQVHIENLDDDAPAGCVLDNDIACTVTVHVHGWKYPIVRTARLSRWYKGSNPNWKDNPEHMLELNTVAHALEYITPGATEDDERPPDVVPAADTAEILAELKHDSNDEKEAAV